MFTAMAIICMLDGPPNCESISNRRVFTTREACLHDKPNADVFANSVGRFVLDYACYNWGVRA